MRETAVYDRRWLAIFILYAAVLFYLSSIPGKEADAVTAKFPVSAAVLHFSEFLIFLALGFMAFKPSTSSRLWLLILFSMAYAASDEMHQLFVPGRNASMEDFAADTLGIFSASAVIQFGKLNGNTKLRKNLKIQRDEEGIVS